ncbi:hypothetical protein ACFOMD_05995 [Sphingoaurantiacus capsulatus]|uniref:DUF2268 domain-containing protein n=1 Tax=Sphingoaurantiacus capsulatus TaxID=1771310 RepID=A0ABV7X7I3_9SPHN
MILRSAMLAAALLVGSSALAAPATGKLQLIDLTDDFAREWDRTAALPDAERVAAFKAAFAKLIPGFYDHQRMGLPGPERYDEHLLKALKTYPEKRDAIAAMSRDFAALFAPALASYEARFGPMTGYPPIYLVNSIGEFDGGTRDLPEGVRLLFGADVMAKNYANISAQPFFHHELFHLMHGRTFPECQPVWCALWTEGLAVYAAVQLNPKATDDELLLNWPTPLRAAVDGDRTLAVCDMCKHLESTAPKDYRVLFSNGKPDTALPARYGYYLGYLIAAEAGKTRSPDQLAALKQAEVRPLIDETLAQLATCAPE